MVILMWEPPAPWAREIGSICPFGVFFPQYQNIFLAQFGGNPCSEASCGVVTLSLVLKAFQVALGSWNPKFTICPFRARVWPFQAPKTLRFKGKMGNFEAKNTVKQAQNAKRTNGTHFTRVHPPRPENRLLDFCVFLMKSEFAQFPDVWAFPSFQIFYRPFFL